jgi:hypothetical protein
MSDDKIKTGSPDRDTVNTKEPYEVQYWCKKFGCTIAELTGAVQSVGKSAKAVEKYLKKKK